jgi:hypothetical protein
MDTATQNAVPKRYIPEWLKMKFSNTENLKTDIQNRITDNLEAKFIKALNDIKGDTGNGTDFSEITLLALAYFYSEIFTDSTKNEFYTLEMVKGFFDADNLTPYTAIHEIDVEFHKLTFTPLFNSCWLIIQTAYFFNSEHFGHHQHIDYVNHYIATGQKLPIENYNGDVEYLEKSYTKVDNAKTKKIPINGFTLVKKWHFYILYLVCKELNLSTDNFIISEKKKRQYNPVTKCSRALRPLTPIKVIECDIKSANPTFIDYLIKSNLKDHVYNTLMQSLNITRTEAKILYNKNLNSGHFKSEQFMTEFFKNCGYSDSQCIALLALTCGKEKQFYLTMTEVEKKAIYEFVEKNNIAGYCWLHDAIIFIARKVEPQILQVFKTIDFDYKVNTPVIKETFAQGNKRLKYAYINSIPQGLKLISKVEFSKPESKGTANGFKFYKGKFEYLTASFNMNDYKLEHNTFKLKCTEMFEALIFLNQKPFTSLQLLFILRHIRQNSNLIFNVRAFFYWFNDAYGSGTLPPRKSRNYDIVEKMNFKKNIDFIKALSEAEKLVNIKYNFKDLFDLLDERFNNNDYSYIDELSFKGHKGTNLLSYAMVQHFNLLCTGQQRKQRYGVKSEPLYNTPIKDFTVKSLSLKPQQQNAFFQKKTKVYERELKAFNRLVNNRTKANQIIFLLIDIAGFKTDILLVRNNDLLNDLKIELLNIIDKENTTNAVEDFNKLYPKVRSSKIEPLSDLNNVFDTNMQNSIFNQIDVQQAHEQGEKFFIEYLKFHNLDKVPQEQTPLKKKIEKFRFAEFDFDAE